MITIKEIAEKAGVSIGTVDRVIHNRGRVSASTKEKIRRIMESEGYRTNIVASQLSNSRKTILSIIMPHPHQNDRFWEMIKEGIDEAVNKLSFLKLDHTYHFYDRYDSRSFRDSFEKALDLDPSGLLLPPILADETKAFESRIPEDTKVIFFNSDLPGFRRIASIGQDSYESGRTAGRLMDMMTGGKGNIAVIEVEPKDFHINTRAAGFKDYMKENCLCRIFSYLLPPENHQSEFEETVRRILKEHNDLKGLFVPNSSVHFFAERLPGRVRIIGYDLVRANALMLEKGKIDFLINQLPRKQGELAMEYLIKSTVLQEDVESETRLPIEIICKENLKSYQ